MAENGNGRSRQIGPYELRGKLGRGAMARVWRAWDPKLQREVAIKEPTFDPGLPRTVLDEMERRFVTEGRAVAGLNHPNIVTIYAADIWDDTPAIVMELVEGVTLAELLESGPLAPAVALDALDQLLDAVGYAHARGVVHRDIKPDNVFVDREGRVKLADFGIARVEDSASTRVTVTGAVLGTPGYMSPEQATGATVDGRSDLFSIGIVAYEMLTGSNPFGEGEATTLLYRIVHEPAPNLPEWTTEGLPADLRPAIMAALAKDPEERPQTAAEFKKMLHGGAVPTLRMSGELGHQAAARRAGAPSWLPYAIVAAIGVVVLAIVLVSATSRGAQVSNESRTNESTATVQTTSEQKTESDDADTEDKKANEANETTEDEKPASPQSSTPDVQITSVPDVLVSATGDGINIRALPQHQSDLVAEIDPSTRMYPSGEVLQGLGSDGAMHDWYYVTVPNVAEGWVRSDLVSAETSDSQQQQTPVAQLASGTGDSINLRAESRHDSALVVQVPAGAVLNYYGQTGVGYGSDGQSHTWYYVEAPAYNAWGWVRSDLMQTL